MNDALVWMPQKLTMGVSTSSLLIREISKKYEVIQEKKSPATLEAKLRRIAF
jgi:hypothetical protein